jgi:hypothetical protein
MRTEDEDERRRKGIAADGETVRIPLMLCDSAQRITQRRAFNVPMEMSDAAAADFIAGYKVATRATAQLDGSLHRPGYRYPHMIPAASQVRDGVSLADAERVRAEALQQRITRDANAWRRPEARLHLPTHTADTSAKVVDVRSLSLEDPRAAREQAWHQRNERDRKAWRQPARPVATHHAAGGFRQLDNAAARAPQRNSREEIENTPLAELRARADKARAERDERDRNAWRREPSPYLVSVQKAEGELRNAEDPIAKAAAAENLRIATVGGRGA